MGLTDWNRQILVAQYYKVVGSSSYGFKKKLKGDESFLIICLIVLKHRIKFCSLHRGSEILSCAWELCKPNNLKCLTSWKQYLWPQEKINQKKILEEAALG